MRLLLFSMTMLTFITSLAQQPTPVAFKIDTSKVAVLPATEYISAPIQATISEDEIQSSENLVAEAFRNNNKGYEKATCQPVDYLSLYKRQYFPALEDGQKVVYVNCFVDNKNEFSSWKKNAVVIFGGRIIQIKLNLDKKECTSFQVSRPCFSKLKVLKTTINPSVL